jgi:hypothetical protein
MKRDTVEYCFLSIHGTGIAHARANPPEMNLHIKNYWRRRTEAQ